MNVYDVDSPELYTIEEIHDLIQNHGIESAINCIDITKVPDSKLRNWLEQFETLAYRINSRVSPAKVVIGEETRRGVTS